MYDVGPVGSQVFHDMMFGDQLSIAVVSDNGVKRFALRSVRCVVTMWSPEVERILDYDAEVQGGDEVVNAYGEWMLMKGSDRQVLVEASETVAGADPDVTQKPRLLPERGRMIDAADHRRRQRIGVTVEGRKRQWSSVVSLLQ